MMEEEKQVKGGKRKAVVSNMVLPEEIKLELMTDK